PELISGPVAGWAPGHETGHETGYEPGYEHCVLRSLWAGTVLAGTRQVPDPPHRLRTTAVLLGVCPAHGGASDAEWVDGPVQQARGNLLRRRLPDRLGSPRQSRGGARGGVECPSSQTSGGRTEHQPEWFIDLPAWSSERTCCPPSVWPHSSAWWGFRRGGFGPCSHRRNACGWSRGTVGWCR